MGKLDGKVAFISGGARGQGRSHAVRLAEEGADIITFDICAQIETVPYPMSTPADLEQTVKEVEATGRSIFARQADVSRRGSRCERYSHKGRPNWVRRDRSGQCRHRRRWIRRARPGLVRRHRCQPHRRLEHGTCRHSLHDRAGRGGSIVLTSSTGGLIGVATNAPGCLPTRRRSTASSG